MPGLVFEYDPPDRFVAGTVGEPGQRTFYLQAAARGRTTSVALEKQQVAALAERISEILDEVVLRSGGTDAPAMTPAGLTDRAPLEQPVIEEFRVGTMALAWDPDPGVLVIEAHAISDADEDPDDADPAEAAITPAPAQPEDEPDVLRVRLTAAAARAFAQRAVAVVGAGRPNCPLCGLPLDPTGHICPRQNGYRRR
jgi:uncharacterized repeat protein (TIGR03847 family)